MDIIPKSVVVKKGKMMDGLKMGEWTMYEVATNIRFCGHYENDTRNGTATESYLLEGWISDGEYCNDKRIGIWYFEDRNRNFEHNFDHGDLVFPDHKFIDDESETGYLVEGRKRGIWIDKITRTFAIYEHDLRTGYSVSYYKNGNIECEGEYFCGKNYKTWTYYHKNGQVNATGPFTLEGIKCGRWKYYHQNGNRRALEEFNGKASWYKIDQSTKHGNYCVYHENGKIKTRGQYKDGKKFGTWKTYNVNGKRSHQHKYN